MTKWNCDTLQNCDNFLSEFLGEYKFHENSTDLKKKKLQVFIYYSILNSSDMNVIQFLL